MTNELADRLANGGRTFDGGMFLDAELLRQVIAALRAEPVAWTAHGIKREDTCVWVQDSDGPWNTSCGKVFEFTNDGPAENEANFCYHCGGALLPEPYSDAAPSRETAKQEAEPALSAEQIEHCRRYGVTTAMRYALCDAALSSLTARDEFAKEKAALSQQWLDWGVKRRDEGIEAAAKALAAMPVREERLGGQATKYIQRDEAINTVRALKGAGHD